MHSAPLSIIPLKILVVENHEDTLTYLSHYLKLQGHTIHSAQNMRAAMASLAESPVDVIISDITLPDGNGWDLMQHARAVQKHILGIAMSGLATPADQERSRNAGYAHHLIKPFLPEDLDALLQNAEKKSV